MALIIGMHCPHCGSRAQVRTSTALSPTMRQVYFLCNNLVCGHSWVASLEAMRTISPSAIPNPAVDLPIMRRDEVLALDAVLHPSHQRSLFDETASSD